MSVWDVCACVCTLKKKKAAEIWLIEQVMEKRNAHLNRLYLYLLGVLQCGVSVVRWFQALHQSGVKTASAFNEPPRHVQLLFQQFIEGK